MGSRILYTGTTKRALDAFADKYYSETQFYFKDNQNGLRAGFSMQYSPGAAILKACGSAEVSDSFPVLLVSSSQVLSDYFSVWSTGRGKSLTIQNAVPRRKLLSIDVPLVEGFTPDFSSPTQGVSKGKERYGIHEQVDYDKFSKDLATLLYAQKLFRVPRQFTLPTDLVWHYTL